MNIMKTYSYKYNTVTTLKGCTKSELAKDEVIEGGIEDEVEGTYEPFEDSKGRVEETLEPLEDSKGRVDEATVSLKENWGEVELLSLEFTSLSR